MKRETTREYLHRLGSEALGISSHKRPLKFPIKFKVFLRLAIGGRRHADRLHLFRQYWRSSLRTFAKAGYYPPSETTDEVIESRTEGIIVKLKNDGVDEEFLHSHRAGITRWRKKNQIEQRKNAINSRWLKVNQKKLLQVLQNRILILRKNKAASSYPKKRKK